MVKRSTIITSKPQGPPCLVLLLPLFVQFSFFFFFLFCKPSWGIMLFFFFYFMPPRHPNRKTWAYTVQCAIGVVKLGLPSHLPSQSVKKKNYLRSHKRLVFIWREMVQEILLPPNHAASSFLRKGSEGWLSVSSFYVRSYVRHEELAASDRQPSAELVLKDCAGAVKLGDLSVEMRRLSLSSCSFFFSILVPFLLPWFAISFVCTS